MQKSIKGQGKRRMLSMKSMMILLFLLQSGCTAVQVQKSNDRENFSCEEEVTPKSLQYLEQQYRCHAEE
jgi:hypothetical protein